MYMIKAALESGITENGRRRIVRRDELGAGLVEFGPYASFWAVVSLTHTVEAAAQAHDGMGH